MPKFWAVVKNVTRIGLAGAVLKLSYDYGIWDSSTDKGRRVYEQAKQKILPGTIEYPKRLPTVRDTQLCIQSGWNKGVQKSFSYVKMIPEKVRRIYGLLRGDDVS